MISSAKNLPLETGVTGMPVAIYGTNGKLSSTKLHPSMGVKSAHERQNTGD